MKMNKNIQWKKSNIDYDKLNKLDTEQLNRIQNGLNAKLSGQLREAAIEGGKVMGNYHLQNGTGLFGMSNKKKKQSQINGGKVAGKLAVERGTVSKAGKISVSSPNHVNNKTSTCPHCKKEGGFTIMKRWHMDNCKYKK
jgi:hypothetical protein